MRSALTVAQVPPPSQGTRSIWAWARVLGGVCILVLLAWQVGTGPFLDGLRVVNGSALVTAFGIGVLTTVCCAWRWQIVARGLGKPCIVGEMPSKGSAGQSTDDIADVHLFVVTRPRGQKLDTIHVRSR